MSSRIIQALAPRARTARVFVAIAVAGLSAAACDVHGISEPGSLSAIVVSPNPATIAANGTQQFSAVGKDFSGTNVAISPSWSVVAGGGTISASGLFTAGPTPGTYASTVKATTGSISGTATVIVTTGPLASITVTPNPDTLAINGTQLFTAVGRDVAGNVVVITPTWSVVASGGTITTAGSFTAGTVPGTFLNTVKATSGTLSGTADVVVTPGPLATITVTPTPVTLAINGTQQFTAVGKDASGNVVAITPVWSAASGGTIITGTGLFTAGTVPSTFNNTVKAAVGTVNGTATVVVTAGTLASVTVTPDPATVAINGIQLFTAVGRDVAGNVVAITPTWAVVASGGTINATGSFTAGTVPGTFIESVKATSGAFSGTATVVVTAGTLATITVTPNPATTAINGTQQFTAVGKDSSGNVVGITPVWSAASGGTIDATTGLFTAGMVPATFTNSVKATSGSISGTATVVVTAGQLDRITVTPNPDTLAINGIQQFVAVGSDVAGNPVAITPKWAVVASGGTIDTTTGLFTAGTVPGTFIKTVTATSGTHTGTATVVVTAGPLLTITVTPNPDTTVISGKQQFTAVGRDAAGNPVVIAPTWSVVASGGTITATTGLFTAGLTTGTFTNTVKAAVGTVNGTATVVVVTGQLASITVTPNPDTLMIKGTQQFIAVGHDAAGNPVPFTITPTWTVVDSGGTINSTTGQFTAGTVPGTFINTVKATSGTLSGTATVVVTAGPLASIKVTPNPASVSTNGLQQFTAVGKDSSGNVVAITPTWAVVDSGGTINNTTGLFTAGLTAGTFIKTVTATSGALSDSATVVVFTAQLPFLNLRTAGLNGIMAGQTVTCVTGGTIYADVSVSPGSTVTGYPPCVITGTQHLADAVAATGQQDLTTAYNTLQALPCGTAISADLGGTVVPAGVYCTASGIGITGPLTLNGGGDPNAVFVFQAGTSLTTAGDIILTNGAQAKNVYFQVGTSATLGTASQIKGNILALTSITLVDNANLIGRALARNGSVTLGTNNTITLP